MPKAPSRSPPAGRPNRQWARCCTRSSNIVGRTPSSAAGPPAGFSRERLHSSNRLFGDNGVDGVCHGAWMNGEQVIAKLREHEPELKAAGVEHLFLHGSYARGTAGPGGSGGGGS